MRKSTYLIIVFLSITAILFAKKPWPTTVAGTYKIAAFDKVPDAQFDSIYEAIEWLNHAGPVTGNIVFEIASDLTFYSEVGLAKDMNGHSLTIRPDQDVLRTITFQKESDKVSRTPFLFGNIYIGYRTGGLQGQASSLPVADSLITTSNVTIDGYAVGGSTPRLKFATVSRPLISNSIFTIVGGCDNVVVKNCLFELNSTNLTSPSYAVYLYQAKNTTLFDRSPSNILIENNNFNSRGESACGAISFGRVGSALSQLSNCKIRNNTFFVTGCAVFFTSSYNVNVDIIGNEFTVKQGVNKYSNSGAIRYSGASAAPGTINIIGNKFKELSTQQSSASTITGIYISSGSTASTDVFNIYNNTFSGLNRSGITAIGVNVHLCYILAGEGNARSKIYNNTFYLPGLSAASSDGDFCAIKYESATATAWKANIVNNIFATDDDKKSIFISGINAAGTVNNNAYCFYPATYKSGIVRNIGTTTDTIRTLAALKTYTTTYDFNSVEAPVAFTNTLTGDLTLDANLMSAEYCAPLKVARLAEVTTDIQGRMRQNPTLIGAHDLYNTPNQLQQANTNKVKIIRTANGVEIRTADKASIQIHTVNGVLLDNVSSDGQYLKSLDKGVYLIRVNNQTYKFIK